MTRKKSIRRSPRLKKVSRKKTIRRSPRKVSRKKTVRRSPRKVSRKKTIRRSPRKVSRKVSHKKTVRRSPRKVSRKVSRKTVTRKTPAKKTSPFKKLPLAQLQAKAKSKGIPLYTVMSAEQLASALDEETPYSIGWRWKYMKPQLQKKEYNQAMDLLRSPVRDLTKFPKIMRYLKKHPVHITLTTSPVRLSKILAVLATLDVTYVKEINVVLPYLYGRNKEPYNEADITKIAEFPKVKIVRTRKDYGPITKMLPVIRKVRDPKAIVISVDDDVGYNIGTINELIYQKVERHNNATVETAQGMSLKDHIRDFRQYWPQKKPVRRPYADLVEGWMGVAYTKGKTDTKDMEKIADLSKECYLSDDLVISYVLAKNKVPVVRLDNTYAGRPMSYLYGAGEDALFMGGGMNKKAKVGLFSDEYNLEKYAICLKDIQKMNEKKKKKSK